MTSVASVRSQAVTRLRAALKRRLVPGLRATRYRFRSFIPVRSGTRRLLLLSDFRGYTSDQQYAAILRWQAQLFRSAGINALVLPLDDALRRSTAFWHGFDYVGVKIFFRTPADLALAATDAVRARMTPSAKLIYFDGDDDLNVQWPEVLRRVDLYVKKHGFTEASNYGKRYDGKSNLSDYVARRFGPQFVDQDITSTGPIDEVGVSRLHVGWNIALDDRIVDLARSGFTSPSTPREIDVCARATPHLDDWLVPLRRSMADALAELPAEMRVSLPTARVPLEEYHRELRASAICVSPFGYGEICWRDFEATIAGCLVVKPDMSHVSTAPSLYLPGETYAPVAWDYSDLHLVCQRYLDDEALRRRIVERAQEQLSRALDAGWFVGQMRDVLAAADR